MADQPLKFKKEGLIRHLKDLGAVVVAYSGGVDSTFLLAMAHQVLDEKVLGVTATSATYPSGEAEAARAFTRDRKIPHRIIHTDEMALAPFTENGPDRCYHCKKALFRTLFKIAKDRGHDHVAHAANVDDLRDYRPGFKAAEETGAVAPLIDAGLKKEEIRQLSREMGLPTWDKPALACLASRIPYGEPITLEKLKMVEEAEAILLKFGFRQVRVRHHGTIARIELDGDNMEKAFTSPFKEEIVSRLRKIGFTHIALDLEGYRAGSMNRDLGNGKKGFFQ